MVKWLGSEEDLRRMRQRRYIDAGRRKETRNVATIGQKKDTSGDRELPNRSVLRKQTNFNPTTTTTTMSRPMRIFLRESSWISGIITAHRLIYRLLPALDAENCAQTGVLTSRTEI